MSPTYTLIIAFALLGAVFCDKQPSRSPSEVDVKDRKVREIKWDTGAWKPINQPCSTCRDQVLPGPEGAPKPTGVESGVITASPRPNRQANNNLVSIPEKPRGPPPKQTLLFEVAPQVVQPVEIGAPIITQPQLKLAQSPAPQPNQPGQSQSPGRFVFPNDGKKPSHKMHPPLPPPSAPVQQFIQSVFPPRRPVGINPSSTVLLLPAPTLPQQLPAAIPDPRRPLPANRPSADKVIVEVNRLPERLEPEVTIGKGSGKPRVQLIYIPAAALQGRKDPLAGIKGPVTDKLLAELNLSGAKIVSVVKTDVENSKVPVPSPNGVKQVSPFSAGGKLNLDFVKSFLPNGAELISIRGLNGELDVDEGTVKTAFAAENKPSPNFIQNLANNLEQNLREGEKKADELDADRNRPVSPRFRPPISFKPLSVEQPKAKPHVIEQVVLSNPHLESSDPTISNPLVDDGLALVLNVRAFKVKQDLSLIIHNEDKRESMGIEEVIRSLRAVKNFPEPGKEANVEYPEVFIAPSSFSPPRGYAKVMLEIPRESERITSGSPAPVNLPNAYIASRNHLPPDGFVKINLPKEIRTAPQESQSFEARNPFFRDSSEQALESGSQFVPRPFAFNGFNPIPAPVVPQQKPAAQLPTLAKFWIPPEQGSNRGNELGTDEKSFSNAEYNPAPTTIRPPLSNGFRFWPTTRTPSGSFGQFFQSQFFGPSSSPAAVPTTTAAPFTQSTTARYVAPTTYSSVYTTTAAPSTFRYSFPSFSQSTTTAAPVPTFTSPQSNYQPTGRPAPLSYDVPPPDFGAPSRPSDDLPEAFIGPSDIETPEGYVKIQLPVPGIENVQPSQTKLDNGETLPEFFIAPADQEPPEGYVRIALPVAGNNEQTNEEETYAPTTASSTTVVTTTPEPSSAAPAVPQRAPGRFFTRPINQQQNVLEEGAQPPRRRPAYLRPRRPTYETPKKVEEDPADNEAVDVAAVTEGAKVEEPSKDNSSTLFPPFQEAVKRFRGKYVSDLPPTTTQAAQEGTTTQNPNPNYGRRVRPQTRRPFVPGGRRKVLLNRRPVNRNRNELVQQAEEETKGENPTTVQPLDEAEEAPATNGDLLSSGSRFVYHHEDASNAAVVKSADASDDEWWARVNNKPTDSNDAPSNEDAEDSAFVIEALPAEPVVETKEDGTYSSFVPLPADGQPSESVVEESEEPSKEPQEPSEENLSEDMPEEQETTESNQEPANEQEEQVQSEEAVTPETFTATVPGLKQILEDQGIDPEYAAEVSKEIEQSGLVFSVPKLEEDAKYPWRYTTIQRSPKSDDAGADEAPVEATEEKEQTERSDEEVEAANVESDTETPTDVEVAEGEEKPELIEEPEAKPTLESPADEEKAEGSNDIKILGVSTATEVSQESVICFRGKCIQQDGKK